MAVDAVAFDLDGTLYPNRRMYLQSAGLYLRNYRLISKFSEVRREIRLIKPIDNLHDLQAEMLAQKMRIGRDMARSLIDNVIYSRWERTFAGVKPYSTARSTLAALRRTGLKIHLLTDFPVGRKLEYLGLEEQFDVCLSSEDSGYLKPNIEPFQLLAITAGHRIERIAYVGNHYSYDVVGARNAGMYPVYLSGKKTDIGAKAAEIQRFEQVVEVVKTVNTMN